MKKYLILSDICDTKYNYSNELFDWLYNRLYFIEEGWTSFEGGILKEDINIEQTKADLSKNGCRIWLNNGTYTKIYDCDYIFLLDFEFDRNNMLTLKDLINYYEENINNKN